MNQVQISIIIATFNRGDLIIETLSSIQNQTYNHWECIIIDDGSTDGTERIVKAFILDDERFTYEKRPEFVSKGANACRNYGYRKSKGLYLKFFDSDDLMLPNHLQIAYEDAIAKNLDYIVTDCRNFDENGLRERPYETDKNFINITATDFALFRNGWITNDLLVKRTIAGQLEFNEKIRDVASEYQYCVKLLLLTQNGILIPDILTHRRVHSDSLFVNMTCDELSWKSLVAENKLFTLEYVEELAPLSLKRWLLSGFMQFSFDLALSGSWPRHIWKGSMKIVKTISLTKGLAFPLIILSGMFLKKGYSFLKWART